MDDRQRFESNQRTYMRAKVYFPARFSAIATFKARYAADIQADLRPIGMMLDISGGGLCLLAEVPVPREMNINVRLSLPTFMGRQREITGVVVNQRNYHIPNYYYLHTRFIDPNPEIQNQIVQYVFQRRAVSA